MIINFDFNLYFYYIVISDTCNDRIHLNGRQQQQSSVYCSSCSTYIDEEISAPIIQLELPSLTQLTGIFVQNHGENSVWKLKCFLFFLL